MAIFDFITDQFILSGLRQGLSGNAIQKALTANGLGVRRADLQGRIRELTSAVRNASVLKYVNKSSYPTTALYTKGGSYQSKQYLYSVRIELTDPETGETSIRYQNISSAKELTIGEAEDVATQNLLKNNPDYEKQITNAYVETLFQQPSYYS